ncbi:unnamed protein product [Nippostrongylus brasiliensis]|uniref:Nuclear pore complex protein 15 (inferred by orthology to a C. elegans protein) n=1 Tax=Nippostrongylus brasiliensis TaxID=27835 RepID=A0A158QZ15_NIPBR|nr:unnamed protein product [Nippostrongylus brasiliensis]
MVRSDSTNELELVLDRTAIKYPALVMETFLSVPKDEIRDDCTALSNEYCWLVSKNTVFVWNKQGESVKHTAPLPLPNSGLLYSARSVVVYTKDKNRPPGLLAVSGEGVARHWPSVESSVHSELVIDLASEVTLSVQLLQSASKDLESGGVNYLSEQHQLLQRDPEILNVECKYSNIIGKTRDEIAFDESIAGVSVWLLDATKFRGGVLLLVAGNHDGTLDVSFFLAFVRFDSSALSDVEWFSTISSGEQHHREFKATDESSFVGRVFLCVPDSTANSTSCERTDGVIIVFPNFVQSVYPPKQLRGSNEVVLNKTLRFPSNEKKNVTEDISKKFRLIRIRPDNVTLFSNEDSGPMLLLEARTEGFEYDAADDETFLDDMKESTSQDDDDSRIFMSAFSSFSLKKIVEACEMMQPLLSKSDCALTSTVYKFLKTTIDNQSKLSCSPEVFLKWKMNACSRTVLFLKHLGIYDKVKAAKILISNQRNSRSGVSILEEMTERVSVAAKLRRWEIAHEDHAEILEQISTCVTTVKEIMKRSVTTAAKHVLIHICADAMLIFSSAVEESRKSSKLGVPPGTTHWTTGIISDAYLDMCRIILQEVKSSDMADTELLRLRDYIVRLALFHLNEFGGPIDGHEILLDLYNIGARDVAMELAEKFKDFKVLVKICLDLNDADRSAALDAYKTQFASDDFDMYLCQYLRERNLNELLLEQKGERADRYLLSCDGIRWRREIQNKQFDKNLYAFAKLSAFQSDSSDGEVFNEANRKLVLIKHQMLIPESLMKSVYLDNPRTPLSVSEIIELNMLDSDCAEGHKRALDLVARLLRDDDSAELRAQVKKIWSSVMNHCDWKEVANFQDLASIPFGVILRSIAQEEKPSEALLQILPQCDSLLAECRKALFINESVAKWIRDAVERASSHLKATIQANKEAQERRKRVVLRVPHTSDIFESRPCLPDIEVGGNRE